MLNDWLAKALQASGLTQVQLAEFLTDKLGRKIDKGAVNRMLSGDRKISGDELLAIADTCQYPLPKIEYNISEHEQIVWDKNQLDFLFQIDLEVNIQLTELKKGISMGVGAAFSQFSESECESVANTIIWEIIRLGKFHFLLKHGNGPREMMELDKLMKRVRFDKGKGVDIEQES